MRELRIVTLICLSIFFLPIAVLAGLFDESQPVICGVIETNECEEGEDCYRGWARNINLPQFIRIDFEKRTISGTLESGLVKTTEIKQLDRIDGNRILQGVEDGMGWSLAIVEQTGKMVLSVAGNAVGFAVFGACLPAGSIAGSEPVASAESSTKQFDLIWSSFEKEKRIAFSEAIPLTGQESAAFWPIYESFQEELKEIAERNYNLLLAYAEKYGALSNEDTAALMNEFLDVEENRIGLKRAYLRKFAGVLPPKKVMEYIRLENEIEAAVKYEINRNIPPLK
jgi:hypothetical protein